MWWWFRRASVRDVQCPDNKCAPCSQRLEEADSDSIIQALHTSNQEVVDWFAGNAKADMLRQIDEVRETVREMRDSLRHL